jgi:hypothetical protein
MQAKGTNFLEERKNSYDTIERTVQFCARPPSNSDELSNTPPESFGVFACSACRSPILLNKVPAAINPSPSLTPRIL